MCYCTSEQLNQRLKCVKMVQLYDFIWCSRGSCLLLSTAPYRGRHSGSSQRIITADHFLSHPLSLTFSSVNPLHYIHKSPLWLNFFSIAWQLHIQYPFPGSPPLHMSKASQSCILTTVLTWDHLPEGKCQWMMNVKGIDFLQMVSLQCNSCYFKVISHPLTILPQTNDCVFFKKTGVSVTGMNRNVGSSRQVFSSLQHKTNMWTKGLYRGKPIII